MTPELMTSISGSKIPPPPPDVAALALTTMDRWLAEGGVEPDSYDYLMLRALAEQGIRPDLVVGTSIGSAFSNDVRASESRTRS